MTAHSAYSSLQPFLCLTIQPQKNHTLFPTNLFSHHTLSKLGLRTEVRFVSFVPVSADFTHDEKCFQFGSSLSEAQASDEVQLLSDVMQLTFAIM